MSDNRIIGEGYTRTWEYTSDGTSEHATFFLGDSTLTVSLAFAAAQKIADAIDRARREGYRTGVSAALQVLKNFERSC